jgi:hypothetical protein
MIDKNLILCIHKIYNITSVVDIERIINNNDYYTLVNYADSFEFNTRDENITLKTKSNDTIIIHYSNSMSGTHSVVHKGFFNDINVVVKERKSKYNIEAFATELFLQVCLFCLQRHINKCSNYNITTIPNVYKVCILNKSPAIIIQDVDISLQTFIAKHTFKEIIPVLLILVFDLYVLQLTCEFMHRDLHLNNILVEILPDQKTYTYGNFSFTSKFQPYFIDFGYACFNFATTCLQLSQNKIAVKNYYPSIKDCNFNRTHDLKTLFSSMFDDLSCCHHKNQQFFNYLKHKLSKYLQFNQNDRLYIYFYKQINVVDNDFLPEIIFKELKSIF